MTDSGTHGDFARVGLSQGRVFARLRAELDDLKQQQADLRACHDEHYAGMLAAMEENEELRGTLNACAFDRHTFLLHNADFEVCEDWLCDAARAALKEGGE